ncbi:hypothetical protein WAJ75_22305, partial [Acinetobacter baumannii]
FKVGLGTLFSTALYERLLPRDLSMLDVEQTVASWPAWSDMERDIRQLDEHPALIERALEECQAKYIPAAALRERLEVLRSEWPEL